MPRKGPSKDQAALRALPSVDEVIRTSVGREIAEAAGAEHATEMARRIIARMRSGKATVPDSRDEVRQHAVDLLRSEWDDERSVRIRRVINATGVVIHTNLGRAPLSDAAVTALADASRYCTLEYDTGTGKRGKRGRSVEELLMRLTGTEDVLVVNNCAAAAFFVLTAFAAGGEVLISRGELVEIGGDFRVPDVLESSGATLREIGTTNRTKLTDYEKGIRSTTRMILRVHPSNYRIVGFTARPEVKELAALARKHKLVLYEDIGSGALADLSHLGLAGEPVVSRSIRDGATIVTFSGDKLIGGPQAGIIAGKRKLIDTLRKHPLYRALRVDKLTYAALQATLESHRAGTTYSELPVLRMLAMTPADVEKRVDDFIRKVQRKTRGNNGPRLRKMAGRSAIGGGAAPGIEPETVLIAVSHAQLTVTDIDRRLRSSNPPVIARQIGKEVVIDMRTIFDDEVDDLISTLIDLDG